MDNYYKLMIIDDSKGNTYIGLVAGGIGLLGKVLKLEGSIIAHRVICKNHWTHKYMSLYDGQPVEFNPEHIMKIALASEEVVQEHRDFWSSNTQG
jgi:hypothetical protein|tara:strand:+ start:148 stop:432 length:285 start_codon:yes stop_codon:yes gene_type:complete